VPDDFAAPRLEFAREITMLAETSRQALESGLGKWLESQLEPLTPMRKLAEAARDPEVGSEARALLHTLIAGCGIVSRERAGLEHLPKDLRPILRKLGVTFGALDIYVFALLKPAPRRLLHSLNLDKRDLQHAMLPVIPGAKRLPAGYRPAGEQAIRVDMAEKIIRAAFDARAKRGAEKPGVKFFLDPALAISIGLEEENFRRLLGGAGFRCQKAPKLGEGVFGPPAPDSWLWRPRRKHDQGHGKPKHERGKGKRTYGKNKGHKTVNEPARGSGAFEALAELIR
jgi:ATP-dependent RNA helicase SUPV3L1/SUV3